MRRKRTKEEIEELVRRYEARGGVTKRAFCQQHGIGLSTLGYHLRRRAKPTVRLTRVRITTEAPASTGRYTLVLGNGRLIECGPAELPHLISVVERG
jgi:hypothetical protein